MLSQTRHVAGAIDVGFALSKIRPIASMQEAVYYSLGIKNGRMHCCHSAQKIYADCIVGLEAGPRLIVLKLHTLFKRFCPFAIAVRLFTEVCYYVSKR